jgi:hypothetical protein
MDFSKIFAYAFRFLFRCLVKLSIFFVLKKNSCKEYNKKRTIHDAHYVILLQSSKHVEVN